MEKSVEHLSDNLFEHLSADDLFELLSDDLFSGDIEVIAQFFVRYGFTLSLMLCMLLLILVLVGVGGHRTGSVQCLLGMEPYRRYCL